MSRIEAPGLKHFVDLKVKLGPIMEMGPGRAGQRRIIPIIGGSVSGRVNGEILNLGADWQTVFADGVADLDTRYAFRTEDGALIEIINLGVRHGPAEVLARVAAGEDVPASEYYMRTAARLETGDARYAWVNHKIFVCAGIRRASAVEIAYYAVE